ncbi:hypothetical protein [Leifsonia sp. RAF41]|uniref:hypothetical protein n=1 Tax=Leifsonia sp. RAF41 TaxID=3233056 RepID=UPI003F97CBB9
MVSQHAHSRAPIALSLLAGAAVLGALLSGCAPQSSQADTATPSSSASSSSTHTPSATPTSAAPSATPTALPTPEASSVPSGNPAAKALAVRACEAIADGFAADRVTAAAPLAAQAAAADAGWKPLADKLEFIRTHPIDPETGEGPQATIDYSAAVAHDCFAQAGVTVSQD